MYFCNSLIMLYVFVRVETRPMHGSIDYGVLYFVCISGYNISYNSDIVWYDGVNITINVYGRI